MTAAVHDREQFYALAEWAVLAGLVTWYEVEQIARSGSRKNRYWGRHREDLTSLIQRRSLKCKR